MIHAGEKAPQAPLVAGIGHVAVEITGICQGTLSPDIAGDLEQVSIQVGGTMAIALATASQMGCRSRFGFKIADDFLGKHAQSALASHGLETHAIIAPESQMSRLSLRLFGSNQKYMGHSAGDTGELTESDFSIKNFLSTASALLLDGSAPRVQIAACHEAQTLGIPVVFDGSSMSQGTGSLVAGSTVAICSEKLAMELTGGSDLQKCARELMKLGPKAVVITLGEGGAVGLFHDQWVSQPVPDVPIVDRTGAGSVFHGAFASALLGELPFEKCLAFACTAATLSVQSVGSFAGIPSRTDVVVALQTQAS